MGVMDLFHTFVMIVLQCTTYLFGSRYYIVHTHYEKGHSAPITVNAGVPPRYATYLYCVHHV